MSPAPKESPARWFALAVHTRSESTAAAELRARVDEVFLPVRVERRPWSDRVKRFEVPLFPGYLFVRTPMSAARRVDLLRCRHVVDLVGRLPGDDRVAAAIPDHEVSALQVVVASEQALDPIERLVPGKHVLVASGPLRGAHGIVEQAPDGHRRLVVQVGLLGRGVRAVLQADDVVESLERAA